MDVCSNLPIRSGHIFWRVNGFFERSMNFKLFLGAIDFYQHVENVILEEVWMNRSLGRSWVYPLGLNNWTLNSWNTTNKLINCGYFLKIMQDVLFILKKWRKIRDSGRLKWICVSVKMADIYYLWSVNLEMSLFYFVAVITPTWVE